MYYVILYITCATVSLQNPNLADTETLHFDTPEEVMTAVRRVQSNNVVDTDDECYYSKAEWGIAK